MPDDHVTIDPEFRSSPQRAGSSRWVQVGVVAAAAFMLGWLLRSPAPPETEAAAMSMPTTVSTLATAATSRAPIATTSTTVAATVGMAVPLGEVVPGFGDAVTIAMSGGLWGEEVDIVRWNPSQPDPETIVSFRGDSLDGWVGFVGLDAAGTWYAVQDNHAVLSVRPVAATGDEESGWEPGRETVALRVIAAYWHDTSPGRLAWLSCPTDNRRPRDSLHA